MSRQLSQDEMLAGRAEVPADSGTLAPAAVIQCFDRGLSTPAEKELGIATLRKHQHMFAPQSQPVVANDYMSKPNRWNGPRGVADKDLTVSEKKCIVAAERNRGHQLSFAERKELMLRFRADMAKFAPAKPIKIS
jgi:hypothetical protein